MTQVRGIRGAITTEDNSSEAIYEATKRLFAMVVHDNQLEPEVVASIMLTMTPDLTAAFPATAIRSHAGWEWVPLMCAQELNVPGSLPRCIRILIHVNTAKTQLELNHVYLGAASILRPDLAQE